MSDTRTALLVVLLISACGGGQAQLCEWDRDRMAVDASCLPNDEWPLTVASGTLVCDSPAVWFESGGRSYAINGVAQTRDGIEALEPIWRENPDIVGARINIGPLHDLVRDKCP